MSQRRLTGAEFERARDRRIAWTNIAAAFEADLAETIAEGGEAGRTRYQKEASRHTGYTIGMLRSFVSTAEWLRKLKPAERPSDEVVGQSFTALDIIRRIYALNRAKGLALVKRLGPEVLPVSLIRAELKQLAPSRSALRRTEAPTVEKPDARVGKELGFSASMPSLAQMREWRTEDALFAISKLLPRLSGRVVDFRKPEGVSPVGVRVSAIAWLDEAKSEGDGFEIVNASHGLSRATLSDHVSRAIVAATFFRKYYIVFTPDSSPELVQRTVTSLDRLDVSGLGILWLGAAEPLVRKLSGKPTPDRRDKLTAVCRFGRWIP